MNVYVGLCSIAFITLIAIIFMCDLNMNGYVQLQFKKFSWLTNFSLNVFFIITI